MGQVLWDISPRVTMADIIRLLQTRFKSQLQAERFKVELHARRRAPGESLQQLYQDICRLVTLAYPSAEALLVTHVGKEAFIAVVNDGKLQLDVMKQEPQNVEGALSHAIKLRRLSRTTCWPCTVCAVTGLSEADENAAVHELIEDLNTVAQATKGMTALAKRLWSGHTAPSDAASSLGSVPDAVSTPPVPASGRMALGQPGRGGGCGHGGHQHSSKMDPCHVCGQVSPTNVISGEHSQSSGVQSAIAFFGASRCVKTTATCADIQGDETSVAGLPNWQDPQTVPSLELHWQYLPHLRLFVLLGPGGNPAVGDAVGLRPNSRRSIVCKLLNGANPLHQFASLSSEFEL